MSSFEEKRLCDVSNLIVNHTCFECGFKGEVIEHKRKLRCPQCNTSNDVWLESEEPPENHRGE
jgi:predicted Zn-ribbon and HTH transcriptional regulator